MLPTPLSNRASACTCGRPGHGAESPLATLPGTQALESWQMERAYLRLRGGEEGTPLRNKQRRRRRWSDAEKKVACMRKGASEGVRG